MKAIVCEMCGSNEIVKQDGMYVCQHCNTKYSVEEAKKLMVTIDNSSKIDNLLTVAKNAQKDGNYKQAGKYYDLVLQEDPNNWEAAFYSIYDVAIQGRLIELESATYSILNVIPRTLELIKSNDGKRIDDKQKALLMQQADVLIVELEIKKAAQMFFDATMKHFDEFSNVDGAGKEKRSRVIAIMSMVLGCGDCIYDMFGTEEFGQKAACNLWVFGLSAYTSGNIFKPDFCDKYVQKIKQFEPDYTLSTSTSSNSGGCYIATAVYGSYDCPQVWTLRRFRDYSLAKTWYGKAFIKTYYFLSPTLVRWFGNTPLFQSFWKKFLNKVIQKLQQNGYESSPYNDAQW